MTNSGASTDLSAILRALQGGGRPPAPQPEPQTSSLLQSLQAFQTPYQSNYTGCDPYQPSITPILPPQQKPYPPQQQPHPYQQQQHTSQQHSYTPRPSLQAPPKQPEATKEPPTDPRTITTWTHALRHITRLIARKPEVSERVRRLIQSQNDHEAQWWDGRLALLKQQSERDQGRKKIEEVLRSVGGHVDSSVQGQTPEQDQAEVQRYDAKVHRALSEMERSFRAELEGLGVPFFGTRGVLIVRDGEGEQGKITEGELKELQRRMVGMLVDLCGED